jgi:poly-gamma-glutamate synthesis protein (capsule biosynthesis protein)
MRVARIVLAGLVLLAAGWFALLTYADPYVQVPNPGTVDLISGDGRDTSRVLFLGDFAPTDAAIPLIEKHGFAYQYQKTRGILHSHDAVVANLEAPVTTSEDRWPVPKGYVYKVDPAALPAVRQAGIDAVTLANNHTYDYGRDGLADTIRQLDQAGIAHLGAGMSEADARRGLVLETGGGRVGLLAYLQNKARWRLWYMSFAMDSMFGRWPGAARLRYSDLRQDIARMKRIADLVVVAVHWGENYEPVSRDQVDLGRACVDLGADAVIGHHSHQMQPVGLYRGRPIVYSLGNFAFGTIGRSTMRYGMGAALHLEQGALTGLELIPLLTQNRIVRYQTRVPQGRRLDRFFDELIEGSAAHGATVERRRDRGWLDLSIGANN